MSGGDGRLIEIAALAEAGLAASALVHELRQPLFALKATLQLGAGGLTAEQIADLLGVVEHMEGLLVAWGDVGRQEDERLYDAHEVVRDVVRMLAGRVRLVGATVTVEAVGPVWVHGRPAPLRQVALNLLQNALDAVANAPIRDVSVRVHHGEGSVWLDVEDRGAGVPAEIAGREFEPFVTTKDRQGTGLGLYVAHRLCVEAGGSLTLTSSPTGTLARAQFAPSLEDAGAGGPRKNA